MRKAAAHEKMLPAAVQYGGRERFLLVWGDGSAVVFAGRFTGFLTGHSRAERRWSANGRFHLPAQVT